LIHYIFNLVLHHVPNDPNRFLGTKKIGSHAPLFVQIYLAFIMEHNLKNLKTNNKVVRTLVKDDDKSLCLLSSHDGMKYYIKKLLLRRT
jgi:hypothetical protein